MGTRADAELFRDPRQRFPDTPPSTSPTIANADTIAARAMPRSGMASIDRRLDMPCASRMR